MFWLLVGVGFVGAEIWRHFFRLDYGGGSQDWPRRIDVSNLDVGIRVGSFQLADRRRSTNWLVDFFHLTVSLYCMIFSLCSLFFHIKLPSARKNKEKYFSFVFSKKMTNGIFEVGARRKIALTGDIARRAAPESLTHLGSFNLLEVPWRSV